MKVTHILSTCICALLLSCTSNPTVKDTTNLDCDTLDACLNEVSQIAYSKYGISKEASTLAKKIASFGGPAIPELIALLDSEDPETLKIAGYALGEIRSIDEKYLPNIVTGVKRDIPWLARALGNIQSDAAAKLALDFYLSASSSRYNQEAVAVKRHGIRALPFILSATKCRDKCEIEKPMLLVHIVGELDKATKRAAAERIIEELNTPSNSIEDKRNLIGLFFNMGDPGKFVEDQLHEFRNTHPDLADTVDYAFIGIKSKYSGQVFAEYLRESANILALRDLSEIGPAAQDAGPALIELLSDSDRDIRLGAVRALGYIEYRQAEPLLIPLMTKKGDVRLNWAAATALGMIAQPSSITALEDTSKTHWYPAVRNASKQAVEMIQTGKKHKSEYHANNFAFDFFSYENLNVESCKKVSLRPLPENPTTKLNSRSQLKDLEKLTYDTYILSYGASDEDEQREKDPDGIIEVNAHNIVEHREGIKQTPNVALKTDGGWLAGSDRGEWGGELVFIPSQGNTVKLLDANIEDIYQRGEQLIAVTGLAHLGFNGGLIYSIKHQGNSWLTQPWINLPGAPDSSWFVETGELLINTYNGGSILVSKNGELRMAPCEEQIN